MDSLKNFIQDNIEAFDQQMPIGHEERFMERLNQERKRKQMRNSSKVWAYSAAAVAMIAIGITGFFFLQGGPQDLCAKSDYLCYKVQIQKVSDEMEARSYKMDDLQKMEMELTLEQLTNDYSVESTLPEELSDSERAAILKAYYSQMYEGVKEASKMLK